MTGQASRFSVSTERPEPSIVMVVVEGDVDLGTAPDFETELARAVEDSNASGLVIDLSGVTFIDSTGLNALVRAFERQRLAGEGLALVSSDSRVAMILEVSRLDRMLKRFTTREQALEAVRPI